MAREEGGEQVPAPVAAEGVARGSRELVMAVPFLRGPGASESVTTVLVALGANVLIAVAKSAAAVVTGSASLVAIRRSAEQSRQKITTVRFGPNSGTAWLGRSEPRLNR